jgi:hypothetical protein
VINTVAKPLFEYLLDVRRLQMQARGVPGDSLQGRLMLNEWCNHHLLVEKEPPEPMLGRRPECREYIDYPAPYTFMQEWADVNLGASWKNVTAPVLVAYGTSDFVAIPEDAPALANLINVFHPGQADVRAVPEMDHYLTRAKSKTESMRQASGTLGTFDTDVLDLVRDWLTQKAGRGMS